MRFFCFILIVFLSLHSEAQNIIQNGSAEEISFCPSNGGRISWAPPWESSSLSPDLYHSCGTNGYSVPQNIAGFQEPKNGEGYFGFGAYFEAYPDVREFMQNTLLYDLVAGQQYYVEFYVSLNDSVLFAAHNIGVTFTEFDPPTYLTCYPNCEIYYENDASNPLISKTDWMKVNGTFTAHGGERYIHIGNFRPDSTSEIEFIGGGTDPNVAWNASGYYIDDVWLSHIDSAHYVSINEELETGNYGLEVWPNPATDVVSVQLQSSTSHIQRVHLTDMLGRQFPLLKGVSRNKTGDSVKRFDISQLPNGIYLLTITDQDGYRYTQRLVKQ